MKYNKKILLAHLNSNGDILYSTTIAKQIKEVDYIGCHLTWAVGSCCKSMLKENPHVDTIWEVPLKDLSKLSETWSTFKKEALIKKKMVYLMRFFSYKLLMIGSQFTMVLFEIQLSEVIPKK